MSQVGSSMEAGGTDRLRNKLFSRPRAEGDNAGVPPQPPPQPFGQQFGQPPQVQAFRLEGGNTLANI